MDPSKPWVRPSTAVLTKFWYFWLITGVVFAAAPISSAESLAADNDKVCSQELALRHDGDEIDPRHENTLERGALSRGRGYMGAAMVSEPDVIVFAGGIGRGGTVVEASADAFSGLQDDEDKGLTGRRAILSLRIPRTDMGAGSTERAMYFAGGCGVETPIPPEPREEAGEGQSPEPARGEAGGEPDEGSAPLIPLLVRHCQPTDVVDVFAPMAVMDRAKRISIGKGKSKEGQGKVSLGANTDVRLCEPKYAASVGVFYTGTPDDGNPSKWSGTAHVMVAGGIIPISEGQYTATDTVDVLQEETIDPTTGKVEITKLPMLRLPNPPRFEMTSCCFKQQCVFAGGRVSMGPGGVGFNSDRADVWDGGTWSFATWGEHTLSEPRHLMGSAVIELWLGETKRVVGVFAGGVSNTGNSGQIDMFDFQERRILPRLYAPTVSGPTQGVSLSREAAAFVSETGQIDVLHGRTLCWASYKAEGFFPGVSVVGRSPAWFFNESSAGFQSEDRILDRADSSGIGNAAAFVGGGVGDPAGADVSRDVKQISWGCFGKSDGGREDMEPCMGGTRLDRLQKICGEPGPDGSIQSFTPRSDDHGTSQTGEKDESEPTVGVSVNNDGVKSLDDNQDSGSRLAVYIFIGLGALIVSYMVSATLILRKVEGLWRLPFGGGVFDSLCGASSCCCWRVSRRTNVGENSALLPSGVIETVSSREGISGQDPRVLTPGIGGGLVVGGGTGASVRGGAEIVENGGPIQSSSSTIAPSSRASLSPLLARGSGSAGAAGNIKGYDTMYRPLTLADAQASAMHLHAELKEDYSGCDALWREERRDRDGCVGSVVGGSAGHSDGGECNGQPNHFFPPKAATDNGTRT